MKGPGVSPSSHRLPQTRLEPYRVDVPAGEVHAALRQAIDLHERSERSAVLWFGEIARRRLFLELGYTSMHEYADQALGFSKNRTYRFLRLAEQLERLPRLKSCVADGRIGWTVAREIVKVADRTNEKEWIALARRKSRREVESRIREAKLRRLAQRTCNPDQVLLRAHHADAAQPRPPAGQERSNPTSGLKALPDSPVRQDPPRRSDPLVCAKTSSQTSSAKDGRPLVEQGPPPECPSVDKRTYPQGESLGVEQAPDAPLSAHGDMGGELIDRSPITVSFRLSPMEYARYEALVEALHKGRVFPVAAERAELLLLALETLLESAGHGHTATTTASPAATTAASATANTRPSAHDDAVGDEVGAAAQGNGTAAGDLPRSRGPAGTRGGHRGAQPTAADTDGEGTAPSPGRTDAAAGHGRISQRRPSAGSLPRGKTRTPYQIIIYQCEQCRQAHVLTNRGLRPLTRAETERASCDATLVQAGLPNRAAIPSAVRREVLQRDQFRCRTPGCRRAHYLEVHHRAPRESGGTNHPENLITLCSRCHRLAHERGLDWVLRKHTAD